MKWFRKNYVLKNFEELLLTSWHRNTALYLLHQGNIVPTTHVAFVGLQDANECKTDKEKREKKKRDGNKKEIELETTERTADRCKQNRNWKGTKKVRWHKPFNAKDVLMKRKKKRFIRFVKTDYTIQFSAKSK